MGVVVGSVLAWIVNSARVQVAASNRWERLSEVGKGRITQGKEAECCDASLPPVSSMMRFELLVVSGAILVLILSGLTGEWALSA